MKLFASRILLNFRCLGFNTNLDHEKGNQKEANISLVEVAKLEFINPISDVLPDNFNLVANNKSNAWKKTFELGPFDIVDLDLCDGFAASPPNLFKATHYDALNQIFSLQSKAKNPWLLFLTTRVGAGQVDSIAFKKFVNKYRENLNKSADFMVLSKQLHQIYNEESLNLALEDEQKSIDIFLTGLCKWMASLSVEINPPVKIELKSVLGYRVQKKLVLMT